MGIRTILVTGAAGNIGRDLCPRLSGSFEVHAGVRRAAEGLPNPVMCQLRDFDSVLKAVQDVDAVVHLAGQSWEEDVHEYMIPDNITGCYHVFEAARRAGVERVVFASTHHVVEFHIEEGGPVGEEMPVRPDTFYAVTKVFGEALGRYYAEVHGLSTICARIGNFLPPEAVLRIGSQGEPRRVRRIRALWLSPRDMAQFVTRCLTAEGIAYEVLNCASGNTQNVMDLSRARQVLSYEPEDDADRLLRGQGLLEADQAEEG